MPDETWSPKSREDWVNLFADGVTKSRRDREEEEAKAAAEKAKNDPPATEEAAPSFAARFLGG